jgi:hypothetical protein
LHLAGTLSFLPPPAATVVIGGDDATAVELLRNQYQRCGARVRSIDDDDSIVEAVVLAAPSQQQLEKAQRVLKPGGVLLLATPVAEERWIPATQLVLKEGSISFVGEFE